MTCLPVDTSKSVCWTPRAIEHFLLVQVDDKLSRFAQRKIHTKKISLVSYVVPKLQKVLRVQDKHEKQES
jgi:hypothetical protein